MKRILRSVWIGIASMALAFALLLLSEIAGLSLAAKAE